MAETKIPSGKEQKENVCLRREVGLLSAVSFMLSFVIGTGIFVTPGIVLRISGSVGVCLIMWILCGVISFLACLPFGELSTVVPKSGSIYIYLFTAFNSWHPFFGGLPAFTFFWIMYVIILPCSNSLAALLFSDYLFVLVEGISGGTVANATFLKSCIGALCLVVIGLMNCVSVKVSLKSQNILASLKMVAIVAIVFCGFYMFVSGKALEIDVGFEGTDWSVFSLTQALSFGLYTYDGGCFITTITEEIKNPKKNILRSILIGLTITTLTFVLLNVTFLSALHPDQIASGQTVIAQFAKSVFGVAGGTIAAAIVCLALLGAVMSGLFYSSRIGYVAAREGHMAEFLCCIQKKTRTPAPAVVTQVMLSLAFYFIGGEAGVLIDMYTFFIWLAYGATMLALFVLRKQLPNASRPFRVPTVIPVVVGLISFYLFVVSILSGKPSIIIAFIVCILLSTIFFYIFVYKKVRIQFLGLFLKSAQSLFGLVPPSSDLEF